jgi:hypothetical protein
MGLSDPTLAPMLFFPTPALKGYYVNVECHAVHVLPQLFSAVE